MSQLNVFELRQQVEQSHASMVALVDGIERKQREPVDKTALLDTEALIDLMTQQRRQLKVTLEDLAVQTDISVSTLKRMFADPSSARFANVIAVLNELEVDTWARSRHDRRR